MKEKRAQWQMLLLYMLLPRHSGPREILNAVGPRDALNARGSREVLNAGGAREVLNAETYTSIYTLSGRIQISNLHFNLYFLREDSNLKFILH